jgi:predicted outer membrane repeat protein
MLAINGVVALCGFAGDAHGGSILYVNDDAPPDGDGSSWATALNDLELALAQAAKPGSNISEIWVAAGTYRPTATPCGVGQGIDLRTATFELISGVALYGGFNGSETAIDQRDIAANQTILSGELGPDVNSDCCNAVAGLACSCSECAAAVCAILPSCCDTAWDASCAALALHSCPGLCATTSPAYHVVTASGVDESAILDGFVISGGSAMGGNIPIEQHRGGGLLVVGGYPTIRNCTFTQNDALMGGGAAVQADSHAIFEFCQFVQNDPTNKGSALAIFNSSAQLLGCVFTDHEASNGGAIYCEDSLLTLDDCFFERNQAGSFGGSMYTLNSIVSIDDSVFLGGFDDCGYPCNAHRGGGIANEDSVNVISSTQFLDMKVAGSGGGIFNFSTNDVTIIDCLFENNRVVDNVSDPEGGAIDDNSIGSLSLLGCTFIGNEAVETNPPPPGFGAQGLGGAVRTYSDAVIIGCDFIDNVASAWGGALANLGGDSRIEDCLFEGNEATFQFGGALYGSSVSQRVKNCTFRNNVAAWGGAIGINYGNDSLVANCTFAGNSALAGGAYASWLSSQCEFVNCLILGNAAERYGGACFVIPDSDVELTNCTIAANVAKIESGGIYVGPAFGYKEPNSAFISNCILWNNSSPAGSAQENQVTIGPVAKVTVNTSCIEGLDGSLGGIGNIGDDPQFVDEFGPDDLPGTVDDDLHLAFGSPCVDAGHNDALPADLADLDDDGSPSEPTPVDLDFSARRTDDRYAADSGVGKAPIVDMGAYERQAPACPSDCAGMDALVGPADLASLLAGWGQADHPCNVDGAGVVGPLDLAMLLSEWGDCY